jgi:hypothetical protein
MLRTLLATYITLERIGFEQQLIEQAMVATGGMQVESALDWVRYCGRIVNKVLMMISFVYMRL